MFIDRHYWFRRRGDGSEGRPIGRGSRLGRWLAGEECGTKFNNFAVTANPMAKKKSKHYPVVTKSPLSNGGAANTLVDTARNLSVLNRRLYRYGRNYEVKIDLRNDTAGQVEVFALRDDWAVQKAFQMAYQEYLDNTMDERENLSSTQIARWEDFRLRDGLTLAKNDARPVMHTSAGAASVLTSGEFQFSKVVDGAGTTKTFTWGAGATDRYGVLEEYDKVSNAHNYPDQVPADAPYANIDTEVDEATHDNLQADGDAPPYDQNGVNTGSPWVRIAVLGGTAGTQKLSSGYFTAPCGLVLLVGYGGDDTNYSASLEVKAGDYKGVHAPSMIEVATVNRKRKVVK